MNYKDLLIQIKTRTEIMNVHQSKRKEINEKLKVEEDKLALELEELRATLLDKMQNDDTIYTENETKIVEYDHVGKALIGKDKQRITIEDEKKVIEVLKEKGYDFTKIVLDTAKAKNFVKATQEELPGIKIESYPHFVITLKD